MEQILAFDWAQLGISALLNVVLIWFILRSQKQAREEREKLIEQTIAAHRDAIQRVYKEVDDGFDDLHRELSRHGSRGKTD